MSLPKGIRVSVNNTPQAQDDFYAFNEDGSTLQYLAVLSNDLGGESKVLWSVNQDEASTAANELLTQTAVAEWVTLASGAKVAIMADGTIAYDYSDINLSLIQSLGEGDEFTDTFSYSIRLGNGTISTATVTLTYEGENDAATITGTNTGEVTEASPAQLSFATADSFGVGNFPGPNGHSGIAVADLNGDQNLDIVTPNLSDGTLSVLLGDGAGNFSSSVAASGLSNPHAVVAGDVNGDGNVDIVAVQPSQVSIYVGDGNGGLSAAGAPIPTGDEFTIFTNDVVLADLDDDGDMDFIAVGRNSSQSLASVYLQDNTGAFILDDTYITAEDDRPLTAVLVDMNGDGEEDLLVANHGNTAGTSGSPHIAVLLNNGSGQLGSPTAIPLGSGESMGDLAVADLNGDGRLDIVTTVPTTGQVSILLQNGSGGFDEEFYAAGALDPIGLALADFDGDGDLDISTSMVGQDNVSVLLNNGAGAFGAPETFDVGDGPHGIAAGDFNEDGLADIFTANTASANVSLLLNESGGGPGNPFASGDLDVSDPDAGEAEFQPVSALALEGVYGDFTFDHETGEWTYTLDNSDTDTQALGSGDVVTDELVVTSLDGTATETIIVTITGADDWML